MKLMHFYNTSATFYKISTDLDNQNFSMPQPTAREQQMLELISRMRQNPPA